MWRNVRRGLEWDAPRLQSIWSRVKDEQVQQLTGRPRGISSLCEQDGLEMAHRAIMSIQGSY